MDILAKNLLAIKNRDQLLYQKLCSITIPDGLFEIINSKNGQNTVKIFQSDRLGGEGFLLHSKYAPQKEAEGFVRRELKDRNKKIILLYGFGLGYHIQELLSHLTEKQKLIVMELNLALFKLALTLNDWQELISDQRIKLVVTDEPSTFLDNFQQYLQVDCQFTIYLPSIKAIPPEYDKIKILLEDWNIKKGPDKRWANVSIQVLEKNYLHNKTVDSKNIGHLFGKYQNQPIIVVSSGPSLAKNGPLLKKAKTGSIILAAGSALKPLLKMEVEPDMFCIIDPMESTYRQISGQEERQIPLIFLDTACFNTVASYKGPKYIAANEVDHLDNHNFLIDSGGSVATALLDIAIKMGGDPIILVGQDLSYTGKRHHVDGGMYGENEMVEMHSALRVDKNIFGSKTTTRFGLLKYRNWIENRIISCKESTFINATEDGLEIRGCLHIKLAEAIDRFCRLSTRD